MTAAGDFIDPGAGTALAADELLAGAQLVHTVEVPAGLLRPTAAGGEAGRIRLRPLTVHDLQLITRAAKENDTLVATLMVQHALVEPKLTVAQVASLHAGLARFLLGEVNRISGIDTTSEELEQAATAPLARAAHVLAQEFGWTPDQVNAMTLGQVMLHLTMLAEKPAATGGGRGHMPISASRRAGIRGS